MEAVPQVSALDVDSSADTIKILTANRHQIEENVTTPVKRELLSREKAGNLTQLLNAVRPVYTVSRTPRLSDRSS